MTIRIVVTRGFGNGTFIGTITLVVTRGYAIAILGTSRLMTSALSDRIFTAATPDRTVAVAASIRTFTPSDS